MKASFPRSLSFYQPQYTLLHHYFSASAPQPVLEQKGTPKNTDYSSHTCNIALQLTFGGMCSCLRVAVARVFALVVRCRVKRLLLYSRVGKNRDTWREPPAVPGRAVPPATRLSSLARRFSRYGEAIAYTDLLAVGLYFN